jgi:putative transposase
MKMPEVKRLRDLEQQNVRLKRIVAELDLEIDVIKEVLTKNA